LLFLLVEEVEDVFLVVLLLVVVWVEEVLCLKEVEVEVELV
jgi:hypothetical protein